MASVIADPMPIRARLAHTRLERLARSEADYEHERAIADTMAQEIMALKRERLKTTYVADNPLTVVDVDIDLHTMRYQAQMEVVRQKYGTFLAARTAYEEVSNG